MSHRSHKLHERLLHHRIHRLREKLRGERREPARPDLPHVLWSGLGGFITVLAISILSYESGVPLLVAPFGASCVLLFGAPHGPLSQPRNIIGGHLIATLIGLVMLHLFGNGMVAISAAVGLSIMAMLLTETLHPPAGADPIVLMLANAGWSFFFMPMLVGTLTLVLCAIVFNNAVPSRSYPRHWR